MAEVLEQRHLADGRARSALLVLEPDLLESHQIVREPRLALVHGRIRALRSTIQQNRYYPHHN